MLALRSVSGYTAPTGTLPSTTPNMILRKLDTATGKPGLTKVILEIHRKASEFAMKNPGGMAAMAVAKLGQKKEAIEISIPNVELTWKFGPKEIEQSKIYASHMLALKQIKRLPDFATFFDTSYVSAMEKAA